MFKEYENTSTENYSKAANLVGWLTFSQVKELSLEGVSITTNKIWLRDA